LTEVRLAIVSLLCLLVAACAAVDTDVPVAPAGSQADSSAPATGQPAPSVAQAHAAAATAATENKPAARGTQTPPAVSRGAAPASSPATAARPATQSAAVVPPSVAPGALDLNALKEQLKETKAIGVFTKLTLKNQVDELLQQFRDFYQGKATVTLAQLRRSYDLLLMKVLSLVQDADRPLASSIVASREAIWGLLSDPKKFSTLKG
jgi:hypothetical protein